MILVLGHTTLCSQGIVGEQESKHKHDNEYQSQDNSDDSYFFPLRTPSTRFLQKHFDLGVRHVVQVPMGRLLGF